MAMILGSEYELKVELLNSTLEARKIFLGLVLTMKFGAVSDLTKLFNFESIPAEWQKNGKNSNFCTKLFLSHTKDHYLYNFDLTQWGFKSDVRDTPLLTYLDFIFKNQSEYEKLFLKNEMKLRDLTRYPKQARIVKNTLSEMIPNWKTLQSKNNSQWLCKTLLDWAKQWNLTDDWCLDFALICLKICKANFIDKLTLPENFLNDDSADFSVSIFEDYQRSGMAWQESLIDMVWEKGCSVGGELPEFSYFEYIWKQKTKKGIKKIVEISERYNPFISEEENFRNLVEMQFLENLFLNFRRWISNDGKMKSLTEKLELFQNRVDRYVAKHNEKADKIGIKTVKKRDGDKHFRWLVECEIPPTESYSAVAKRNNVTAKAIEDGIRRVAQQIGLTLIKTRKRRGRPKGSKDSYTRHRASTR